MHPNGYPQLSPERLRALKQQPRRRRAIERTVVRSPSQLAALGEFQARLYRQRTGRIQQMHLRPALAHTQHFGGERADTIRRIPPLEAAVPADRHRQLRGEPPVFTQRQRAQRMVALWLQAIARVQPSKGVARSLRRGAACLEHRDRAPARSEVPGAGRADDAGADHHDIRADRRGSAHTLRQQGQRRGRSEQRQEISAAH